MSLNGKQIVIAGGSGFLGISMATHFSSAGAKVVILSRSQPRVTGNWTHAVWDGRTQGISWIHETDLNSLFTRAITDESMSGVYIASAPGPVSQVEFMRTLRKVINMPIGLPAFEWMVRIGAPLVFRTDPELGLYGRYLVSKRLAVEGFQFRFSQLESALRDLYD